jgi:uncharacterized membrane protein HdeD (DUF308 family)
MATKKTLGITATAFYFALSSIVYTLAGLIVTIASAEKASTLLTVIGTLLIVFGVFLFASVYGLWSLQEWGRKLAIWLSAISIVLGIVAIFPIMPKQQFSIANTILQLVGVAVCSLIISYLSKVNNKSLFNSESQ